MKEGYDIITSLLGIRIIRVSELIVEVPEAMLVPSDTMVLTTDAGHLQLFTGAEPLSKRARLLNDPSQLVLVGDYDDHLSITLREKALPMLPVTVSATYAVYETPIGSHEAYFVGTFVEDEHGRLAMGIRMHLEDLVIGDVDSLWTYVRAIMSGASAILIEHHRRT